MFKFLNRFHFHCWHPTERRWKMKTKNYCERLDSYGMLYKYESECCKCPEKKIRIGL